MQLKFIIPIITFMAVVFLLAVLRSHPAKVNAPQDEVTYEWIEGVEEDVDQ